MPTGPLGSPEWPAHPQSSADRPYGIEPNSEDQGASSQLSPIDGENNLPPVESEHKREVRPHDLSALFHKMRHGSGRVVAL
jgi:hypothetical protein